MDNSRKIMQYCRSLENLEGKACENDEISRHFVVVGYGNDDRYGALWCMGARTDSRVTDATY
jgi:hypothetical protein